MRNVYMAHLSATVVPVFGLVFFSLVLPAYQEKINCYVCHFSPKNNSTEEYCTTDNFRTNAIQLTECDYGCERVSSWDNNGILEHFHRNCYRDNTSISGECKRTVTKAFTRNVCVCNSNLCNDAVAIRGSTWTSILLTTAIMIGSWIG